MKKILFITLCFLLYSCNNTTQQPNQEVKAESKKEYKIVSTSLSGPEVEVIQHPTEGTLFMLNKLTGNVFYYMNPTDSTDGHWECLSHYNIEQTRNEPSYQLIFVDGSKDVLLINTYSNKNRLGRYEDGQPIYRFSPDSNNIWHFLVQDKMDNIIGHGYESKWEDEKHKLIETVIENGKFTLRASEHDFGPKF